MRRFPSRWNTCVRWSSARTQTKTLSSSGVMWRSAPPLIQTSWPGSSATACMSCFVTVTPPCCAIHSDTWDVLTTQDSTLLVPVFCSWLSGWYLLCYCWNRILCQESSFLYKLRGKSVDGGYACILCKGSQSLATTTFESILNQHYKVSHTNLIPHLDIPTATPDTRVWKTDKALLYPAVHQTQLPPTPPTLPRHPLRHPRAAGGPGREWCQ